MPSITDYLALDRFTYDYNNDGITNFADYAQGFFDSLNFGGTTTTVKDPLIIDKNDFYNIIGLPPLAYVEDDPATLELIKNKILQSCLIITLEPCKAEFRPIDGDTGLDLFTLTPIPKTGKDSFSELFKGTLVTPRNIPLKIAVQNDTSFSESWSTDFGDSRFESATNVGSQLGQELRFITGKDSIVDALKDISNGIGSAAGTIFGDNLKNMITVLTSGAAKYGHAGEEYIKKTFPTLGKGLLQLASGSRVDFPQIWQGSSFDTTYQFTLKLYNPYPGDDEAYMKFIIDPIIHMLTFMCPISDSNFTFSFPLMCRFNCPGLAGLDAAYVSNMDIIKGGESNDISFDQRAGSVDIRFSIRPLYNTMIIRKQENVNEERPTLDQYSKHLRGKTNAPSVYNNSTNKLVITENSELLISGSTTRNSNVQDLGITVSRNSSSITDLSALNSRNTRTTLEGMDVFSDPILNNLFTSEEVLTNENINNVSLYKSEYENLILERGTESELPLEDRIALKIKFGIPMKRELINWFWNNTDQFDVTTRKIIDDFERPTIKAVSKTDTGQDMGNFQNGYNLTSRRTATQTGTF